jgi:hypothetical protein
MNECEGECGGVAVAVAMAMAVAEEIRDGCYDDSITSYLMSPLCCHPDHSFALL